jgi:hypothetical protein
LEGRESGSSAFPAALRATVWVRRVVVLRANVEIIVTDLAAIAGMAALLYHLFDKGFDSVGWGIALGVVFVAGLSYGFIRGGLTAMDIVETLEPVTPMTRQNTDSIPPEESLVRAASEPALPQQDVLLRAASGTVETDPQQLLRASADSPSDGLHALQREE